jgi:hypothetical protein
LGDVRFGGMKAVKIILGVLVILGALQQLIMIVRTTHSWKDWPLGADVTSIAMVFVGYLIIKSALKKKEESASGE